MPPSEPQKEAWDVRRSRLSALAKALPERPGVYLMKDADGHVLYVGKAGSLKNRVSSYFVPSAELGPKKQPMLAKIDAIDTIECDGEWEALLMESRLIKDTRPPFNTRLVDDKTFPYLVVTMRDDFPGCSSPENPPMRTTGARKFLVPSRPPARCEKRCNCCNGCFDTAPVIWTSKMVIPKPPLSALPVALDWAVHRPLCGSHFEGFVSA